MKRFLIIVLFITVTYTVYSQGFGIQAGVRINVSDIEYPDVDINRKAGFEGGVSYRHSVSVLPLSIRTALLYCNSEFNLRNDLGNNTGITYHFVENNLKLPLTVEWRPLPGIIKPFIQAGFYGACSFSGSIKDSDSSNSLKYKKSGQRFDYGAVVGLGTYLTSNLALNINYEHGFTDRELELGDQFVSVRNRGCSIVLNYLF